MVIVAAKDIGSIAVKLMSDTRSVGSTHGIATDIMTGEDIASAMSEISGDGIWYPVLYNNIPISEYVSFGFPGASDAGNMYAF